VAELFEHGVNRRVVLREAGWMGVSMNWMTVCFSKTLLCGVTFYIYITNLGRCV
jgi:hypothetical protein